MGSSKADSASDGEDSGGHLPESNSNLFSDGEKVLAYHGPRIYEAKVQKAEVLKNEWKYFVHYLKFSSSEPSVEWEQIVSEEIVTKLPYVANSWDEWVGADRLMKHSEENVLKQQALDKKQGVDKNPKSGRSAQTKPKISSDVKGDKEDAKRAKGKKRKSESGIEKDNVSVEKLVKIQVPSTLKKQLVDDWEFITQQDKLVKLPRSPNVDDILSKYLEYRSKKDGMMTDAVGEILNGIRSYFDKGLPVILLYKNEREQYNEAVVDNASPSIKLPELLAYVNIEEETLVRLQHKLLEFLKFLQKNQGTFFLSAYDGSKVSEGNGKGKEN
ncbi:hypothetical protein RJ639_018916 [Escallonia herrerae]|uniref:MRG domain-containing protein n=1 Tax=Escallonia herrerae TaxID=1293975 RepID=A0AA89AJS2_9ASTE|nr:hypothetical protein RJ639_018916 [Escallonia herrerae]